MGEDGQRRKTVKKEVKELMAYGIWLMIGGSPLLPYAISYRLFYPLILLDTLA